MWRGRDEFGEEQVANAPDELVNLVPTSAAASDTYSNWAALLPATDPVPLIWET